MPLAEKLNQKFTYQDYLTWPDDERWELINGEAYNMSPAPLRIHQKISMELTRQIANFLDDKKCEVYDAPFDVRLSDKKTPKDNEIVHVVQPDVAVICDESKLDEKGCLGAPDWIIEITSPSTASKDFKDKFLLYETHGVKEYWIVLPGENVVLAYLLKDGKYHDSGKYTFDDSIPVSIFNDLAICLGKLVPKEDEK